MPIWLRHFLAIILVSMVSIGLVGAAWKGIGGGILSIHGWIALSLGISGTVALTWVLMRLAFRSDREGWDARAGESIAPAPEAPLSRKG